MTRPGVLLAVAAAAVTLPACSTPWYMESMDSDQVTTHVIVHTEPAGADVRINESSVGAAPVRIPVKYHHETQVWARATNAGAPMRESMGGFGTLLLLPIWLPASIVQYREETRRHVYGLNEHAIHASWPDGRTATTHVKLEGEAEVEVELSR